MSKVNVKSILLNKDDNTNTVIEVIGIKTENKLIYNDGNTLVKIEFNTDFIKMTREEKNKSIIKFVFKENELTKCDYSIYNKQMSLNLFTHKINKNENNYEIDYSIEESQNLNFKLIIEE